MLFALGIKLPENASWFTATETVPDEPPPLKPEPAVTPSMSPASFVKLITPVVEL